MCVPSQARCSYEVDIAGWNDDRAEKDIECAGGSVVGTRDRVDCEDLTVTTI